MRNGLPLDRVPDKNPSLFLGQRKKTIPASAIFIGLSSSCSSSIFSLQAERKVRSLFWDLIDRQIPFFLPSGGFFLFSNLRKLFFPIFFCFIKSTSWYILDTQAKWKNAFIHALSTPLYHHSFRVFPIIARILRDFPRESKNPVYCKHRGLTILSLLSLVALTTQSTEERETEAVQYSAIQCKSASPNSSEMSICGNSTSHSLEWLRKHI